MEHYIITEKCSTLRKLGREALRGRWKLAVCTLLVYSAAIYIPTMLLSELFKSAPWISSIYSLLVSGPFSLGYSIFALSLFRNNDPKIGQIFYGFEKFGKSLGLLLLIALFIFLWYLLIIPGILLAVLSPFFIPFIVLFMVPMFMAIIRYSQAFYILADNPATGLLDCIKKSKMLMAGNKLKYFFLYLSFIGWFILASIPPAVLIAVNFPAADFMQGDMQMYEELAALQGYSFSIGFMFALLIACVGFVLIQAYIMAALTAFYEMVSGNLRPGYITASAEIVEEHENTKENENPKEYENIE